MAATGGYPNPTMACAHSPFATSGSGYWCRNYDWGPVRDTTPGWTVDTTYSARGYGYRNCTDWVAWKLQSLGVPDSKTRGIHDGGQWAAYAPGNGLHVTTVPKPGMAAVQVGDPGHLAFVEAVNGSNITVSEYNKQQDGNYGVRTGTPSALGFSKFVDFGVALTSAPKFTSASPPSSAIVGTAYSYQFTASGTPAPTSAIREWDASLGTLALKRWEALGHTDHDGEVQLHDQGVELCGVASNRNAFDPRSTRSRRPCLGHPRVRPCSVIRSLISSRQTVARSQRSVSLLARYPKDLS